MLKWLGKVIDRSAGSTEAGDAGYAAGVASPANRHGANRVEDISDREPDSRSGVAAARSTHSDFATIYTSFNDLDAVKSIFPRVLEEVNRTRTSLIVHDCSTERRQETWDWYRRLGEESDFFYFFSKKLPFALARNACLSLAMEMYSPQYLCMLEDDHGYLPGAIDALRDAMRAKYGQTGPNGLRYGLFSLCPDCWGPDFRASCLEDGEGNLFAPPESRPLYLGGANSCCRCAPISHWLSVLKGYDVDEYAVSLFQVRNLNFRNYHRGFTALYVGAGSFVTRFNRPGLGYRMLNVRFDDEYTASDPRSKVGNAQ
jgi:hypothetical protein